MQELSLHLLDLLENAVRAGARTILVSIDEDPARDRLVLSVEDDGSGFPEPAERVLDPFFTTKEGKRTGLGLSLLRTAAEQAGGGLRLGRSSLGGALVVAELRLGHVDRMPLGDLPGTLFAMACTHPELVLQCRVRSAAGERRAVSWEAGEDGSDAARGGWVAARRFAERVREDLRELQVTA
ncbi:MAG: ATP-binding protein [Myxococcales bacterium]|nr:ATP-binding protein [Myxococcales bacterium]